MLDNINKNTLMEAGLPYFFICIFPVFFQDFSWSKVRFSRTIIQSESEDCQMLNDHLSLLEKYSILISYLLKKIPGFFQDFLKFFFPRAIPGLKIHLIIFLVFKLIPMCMGTLGGRPIQYLEGIF